MYTQAPARKSKPAKAPMVFVRRGDLEPSPVFDADQCICKLCGSPKLRFYKYLDDAKCSECDQYQNEPPSALNQ